MPPIVAAGHQPGKVSRAFPAAAPPAVPTIDAGQFCG
jgi:hypothetical protein